jgi:deazaflavin-dependent oxidoreductase (nitroreductase family)
LSAHALDRLDRVLARFGGKGQNIAHLTAGLPVVTLTTIGVKSGQRRTAKVLGIAERERMVVIASNFGQRNHPAWYEFSSPGLSRLARLRAACLSSRDRSLHSRARGRSFQRTIRRRDGQGTGGRPARRVLIPADQPSNSF